MRGSGGLRGGNKLAGTGSDNVHVDVGVHVRGYGRLICSPCVLHAFSGSVIGVMAGSVLGGPYLGCRFHVGLDGREDGGATLSRDVPLGWLVGGSCADVDDLWLVPLSDGGVVLGAGGSTLDRACAASLDLFLGRVFLFLPTVGLDSLESSPDDFVGSTESSSESSSARIFPAGVGRVPSGRIDIVSIMVGWWFMSHSHRSLRSSVKAVMCRVAC